MTVTDSGNERKSKRAYSSPLRDADAARRREKIRACAAKLFVRDGYAGTSMREVAKLAGVSERTIFNAFPTKSALLSECIRVAVRGDADATPMLARERWQAVLEAPSDRMMGLLADATADLFRRAARLLAVGEAAASSDPALARERDRGHAATLSDLCELARAMRQAGAIRRAISIQQAADMMLAVLANESVYLRLVDERGWTHRAYARATENALAGALGPLPRRRQS
jgi:AcrR family transcriptional regulator